MKKLTIIFFVLIILVCSCKREPFEWENNSSGIKTSGKITVPTNINQTGWEIRSGMNIGIVSNGNYTININENAVQLITVLNKDDEPVLLSVDVTHSEASGNTLSPESTAEALVFLNPFFCTSDLTEADELKEKIKDLASFNYLVSTISSELQNGSFSLSENNLTLISVLDSVYKDLTSQFNVFKKSLNMGLSEDYSSSPDFEINGLKIVDVQQSETDLSFKIANRAKRWISVYVEKSADGMNFTPSTNYVDMIPSPNISIFNCLGQRTLMPTSYSEKINTSFTGYQSIAIKCYGLGTHNLIIKNLTNEEINRSIEPAIMTAVFDLGIPIFEVIMGVRLFDNELRGVNSTHPVMLLFYKCWQDYISDAILASKIVVAWRESDVPKVIGLITKHMFKTCMNNPRLITQIFQEKLGVEVARATMESYLFPIRLINASITAVNIGASLGSILGTEVVTDFKFDKNATVLPISIKGIIKSYSDSNPISGASVTSYDENGNLQQATVSDPSGNYVLNSKSGNLTLRIFANGFKPTNQVLQIPQDIVKQNPPDYYAPTIWLSKYSSETGIVSGDVKDATNLNPLPGTTIEIRAGVNDMSREIVQQVISGSDGSFNFSEIPSGTYTAFFSKEGYINDFLVLSVLGGQETSGFSMYLSPDIRTTSGFRIVLTWGEDPRDLDSHLFTPDIYGNNYHVYFHSPGDILNPPYVNLDTDDRYSYGPETVTIDKTFPGEYYYSVHHYDGIGSLTSTSNATVNLYGVDGFIRSWTVPSTGDGRWWNVFSINGATGSITNINQISASAPSSYKVLVIEDMKNTK